MIEGTSTRKWRQEDIKEIKEVLPEEVEFGTLSGYPDNSFKLNLGPAVPTEDVSRIVQETKQQLALIGIRTSRTKITADYHGSVSPNVTLEIFMEEQ